MISKPCAHQGCATLVPVGTVRCPAHQKHSQAQDRRFRGSARERGYDGQWERVRAIKLDRDPFCQRCGALGRTTAAHMVHHIVPVERDRTLRLVMSNLESMCNACHQKTHAAMADLCVR